MACPSERSPVWEVLTQKPSQAPEACSGTPQVASLAFSPGGSGVTLSWGTTTATGRLVSGEMSRYSTYLSPNLPCGARSDRTVTGTMTGVLTGTVRTCPQTRPVGHIVTETVTGIVTGTGPVGQHRTRQGGTLGPHQMGGPAQSGEVGMKELPFLLMCPSLLRTSLLLQLICYDTVQYQPGTFSLCCSLENATSGSPLRFPWKSTPACRVQ